MSPSMVELSYQQGDTSWQERAPHKIFVWDPNGVYLDCCFPNPPYGHFLNPQTLKGAHVLDLFSRAVGRRLKNTIHEVWKTQEELSTRLFFERDAQRYEAAVTCVPTQEGKVIGFVRDRLVSPPVSVIDSPRFVSPFNGSFTDTSSPRWSKEQISFLTPQELKVLAIMGFQPSNQERTPVTGKVEVLERNGMSRVTNEDIAGQLHISVRTVKYHFTNIYRKLQITSRHQILPF